MISNEFDLELKLDLMIVVLIFGLLLAIYKYFQQSRIKQNEILRLFQNWKQQLENSPDKIFHYRQSQQEFESKNPDIVDQDFWNGLEKLRVRACILKGQDYWISTQYQ